MTRSLPRGIRVAREQELIDRIHQYFQEVNADPVVFRWKYKLDDRARGWSCGRPATVIRARGGSIRRGWRSRNIRWRWRCGECWME